MRVIPLGTSSGVPTRERYVSAVALSIDSRWILLDCGEGTQYRLLEAPLKPGQLEAIFITHLHGDHVYGIPGLLSTLSLQGRVEALAIHGPPGIREYVEVCLRLSQAHLPYRLEFTEALSGRVRRAKGYSVRAAPLLHRVPAVGYCVEEDERPGHLDADKVRALAAGAQLSGPIFGRLKNGQDVKLPKGEVIRSRDVTGESRPGRKVAYCTDTAPSEGAVQLARGVDLLIHEATYLEELAEQAHERGHSTAADAARIAREAGAKRLLLTHFSPRYRDPAVLVEEARAIFPNTEAARDLAEVTVGLTLTAERAAGPA